MDSRLFEETLTVKYVKNKATKNYATHWSFQKHSLMPKAWTDSAAKCTVPSHDL